jgi:hypothetical protein
VFYFGDGAFEVKCLGEDDLEDLHDCKHGLSQRSEYRTYLLHVDTMACTAEDETSLHGLCESLCLWDVSCRIRGFIFGGCVPDWRSLLALPAGS